MKNELQIAWMGGFVDGEGCLTIAKQIRKNRPSADIKTTDRKNRNQRCQAPNIYHQ